MRSSDLGDLEKPLLAIVLKGLRRDLESRQQRNRSIYQKHSGFFWDGKEADFARTADEVWAEEKQSGAGVPVHRRLPVLGPGPLFAGDRDPAGCPSPRGARRRRGVATGYIPPRQDRIAETIPILEPLVERRPDNLQYRVWLMNAYFKTGKHEQLAKLLKASDDYFHKENRWNENAMAMLGRSCLENEIYQPAADYLREAIALHRGRPPVEELATAYSPVITATRRGPSPV